MEKYLQNLKTIFINNIKIFSKGSLDYSLQIKNIEVTAISKIIIKELNKNYLNIYSVKVKLKYPCLYLTILNDYRLKNIEE